MKKSRGVIKAVKKCAVCGKRAGKVLKSQKGGYSARVDGCEEHPDAALDVVVE